MCVILLYTQNVTFQNYNMRMQILRDLHPHLFKASLFVYKMCFQSLDMICDNNEEKIKVTL